VASLRRDSINQIRAENMQACKVSELVLNQRVAQAANSDYANHLAQLHTLQT
jgi:hypothetical protein